MLMKSVDAVTYAEKRFVLRCLLFVAVGFLICQPVLGDIEKTITYVNGDSISSDMLQRELIRIHASRMHAS